MCRLTLNNRLNQFQFFPIVTLSNHTHCIYTNNNFGLMADTSATDFPQYNTPFRIHCEAERINRLKPIFHQNAKLLALGTFASANAKDSTSALPNAKNTNMLVSLALGDANFLRQPCTFHFFV